MNMSTAHATEITIYPARDSKDCYLLHSDGALVATIIEWADCVEVRVTRKLTAKEHDAAMDFVGTLAGRDCTLINYDAHAAAIAEAGGCQVAKEVRPAVLPLPMPRPPQTATTPRETLAAATMRMILLPVDHDCLCGDSEDDPCPACQATIRAADVAARDRSAAVEYAFYDGLEAA